MGAHMHIRITYMDIDIHGSPIHVQGSQKHMQATKHLGWRIINRTERCAALEEDQVIYLLFIYTGKNLSLLVTKELSSSCQPKTV
jgi:hypothetical protein